MTTGEKTGGSVDYYTARVRQECTVDGRDGYTVQCLEVIETLGMTFAEGEAFKAIWRSCAARTLGKLKADNDAKYNAEKVVFYGGRMLKAAQVKTFDCAAMHKEWTPYREGDGLPGPGAIIDTIDDAGSVILNREIGEFSWDGVVGYRVYSAATPPPPPPGPRGYCKTPGCLRVDVAPDGFCTDCTAPTR